MAARAARVSSAALATVHRERWPHGRRALRMLVVQPETFTRLVEAPLVGIGVHGDLLVVEARHTVQQIADRCPVGQGDGNHA